MDSFQGSGTINIQKGSSNVPYRFQITVASSSQKNDGALPYASTVRSFTVLAHPVGSTASSTHFVGAMSLSSNTLITRLNWTTQIRPGIYQMEFKVVASVSHSTATPLKRQYDFARVYLKERR